MSPVSPKTGALIPVYNSGPLCIPVIRNALPQVDELLIVDDGSEPGTARIVDDLARELGCRLIRHEANLGKGVALYTGFKTLLESGCTRVLTLDADDQHDPVEIPAFLSAPEADMIIGTRDVSAMPLRSRLGNTVTSKLMGTLFRVSIPDTQSGYRLYSERFLCACLERPFSGRYETETLFLIHAIRHGFRVGTVGIRTIYIDRNRVSYFRPVQDSYRVIRSLLSAASHR